MRTNRTARRAVALAVAGLVSVFAMAGCGSSGSRSDGNKAAATGKIKSIAYADVTTANPQFKAVGDALVEAAKARGIQVYRFDNDLNASTTLNNARLMLQKKPDLIINWSAAAAANPAVGKLYEQAAIPCIALNVAIPGCSLFNQRSSDLGAADAEVAAAEVQKRGWDIKKTTLLAVWAPAVGKDINELASYFYSDFAKKFPQMKQADPNDITLSTSTFGDNAVFVDGAAQLQQSNEAARRALGAIPNDHKLVILVLNDDSGLGVKQALVAAGRDHDAVIVGNGAATTGFDELNSNPNWIAEGSVFFDLWGRYSLAMALAKADGVTPPDLTLAPTAVLTKDNFADYYSGGKLIKEPELVPGDNYLKPYLQEIGGGLAK